MPAPHPIEALFARAAALRYPPSVLPTDARVAGPEFFPGGCGLWNAEAGRPYPDLPRRGLVVLGHNLDSEASYRQNVATGGLRKGPTWSNLKRLLDHADVPVETCFLTNFFMGVGTNQTGPFPGARDARFVQDCVALLHDTLRLLQPRAVLVLGGHTWRHLAHLSPALAPLATASKFAALDAAGAAVLGPVRLEGVAPFGVAVVIHPSGATMGGNRDKRRYRGLAGLDAEAALLRDALQHGA